MNSKAKELVLKLIVLAVVFQIALVGYVDYIYTRTGSLPPLFILALILLSMSFWIGPVIAALDRPKV